mgnify:CR=1 FL=1
MIEYLIVTAILIIITAVLYVYRNKSPYPVKIGLLSWMALLLYFPAEMLIISRTTKPYSIMDQAMSDLGVLSCGSDTYPLAAYEICSPLAHEMNIIFILTGMLTVAGAVLLHRFWGNSKWTVSATILFVIYGLGYTMSGVFPADVNFWSHTLPSLPTMFVQIPAMYFISRAIKDKWPGLARFTFICMFISALSLVLIIIGFPAGLMQRLLYFSVWFWMGVTAIILWIKS